MPSLDLALKCKVLGKLEYFDLHKILLFKEHMWSQL